MPRPVVVVDTNLFVSALLLPQSASARALNRALEDAVVVVSRETLEELAAVLARPQFNRYVTAEERTQYFELLAGVVRLINVSHPVTACRNPKDDKFLSLALAAEATCLITGDRDLLDLDPYHGVKIITPALFLNISG
jgi:uncharacterized protein